MKFLHYYQTKKIIYDIIKAGDILENTTNER